VSALCLFVDDLDPSNAENRFQFVVFRVNSSSLCIPMIRDSSHFSRFEATRF
jgi:hypothetical protein